MKARPAVPSFWVVAVAATLATVVLTAAPLAAAADNPNAAKVARGQYLVSTSGCHDCHTPFKLGPNGPEPDMSRALSGHPQSLVMPPAPQLPPGPWLVTMDAETFFRFLDGRLSGTCVPASAVPGEDGTEKTQE